MVFPLNREGKSGKTVSCT